MDRYRATECYRVFADLDQQRCESTYEYFERFRWYMDEYPNHGLQFHELLIRFLNGMRMKEQYILDTMAGGSIWDRTPTEVWYLIQDRAAETRPYTQYIYSQQSLEEKAHQLALARQAAAIAYYKAEFEAEITELDRGLKEFTEDKREQQSAPEPHEFSSEDEEVTVSIEERADEDIMDEELQVVPIASVEDVPTEEWISPQCSDISIDQNKVVACNLIIPHTSNLFLPQNGTIQKALRNNQVWGSLEKVTIHIPMVRNPMRMQKSEQFLDRLCVNWKTRKKGENKMQGSPEKVAFHTHMAQARKRTQRLEKLSEGLRRTWKRRKKRKHIFLDNEGSMFFVYKQKSRSTFGWKPGWSSWRSISHKVTRKVRKSVSKFDGVHPWAPNIC